MFDRCFYGGLSGDESLLAALYKLSLQSESLSLHLRSWRLYNLHVCRCFLSAEASLSWTWMAKFLSTYSSRKTALLCSCTVAYTVAYDSSNASKSCTPCPCLFSWLLRKSWKAECLFPSPSSRHCRVWGSMKSLMQCSGLRSTLDFRSPLAWISRKVRHHAAQKLGLLGL